MPKWKSSHIISQSFIIQVINSTHFVISSGSFITLTGEPLELFFRDWKDSSWLNELLLKKRGILRKWSSVGTPFKLIYKMRRKIKKSKKRNLWIQSFKKTLIKMGRTKFLWTKMFRINRIFNSQINRVWLELVQITIKSQDDLWRSKKKWRNSKMKIYDSNLKKHESIDYLLKKEKLKWDD